MSLGCQKRTVGVRKREWVRQLNTVVLRRGQTVSYRAGEPARNPEAAVGKARWSDG